MALTWGWHPAHGGATARAGTACQAVGWVAPVSGSSSGWHQRMLVDERGTNNLTTMPRRNKRASSATSADAVVRWMGHERSNARG